MNMIDSIVNVTIAIEAPATDGASFSNLLLVTKKAGTVGKETMPDVAVISSADDLTSYGYQPTDDAYKAAAVAFMQDTGPERLYVIAAEDGEDGDTVKNALAKASGVNGWYGVALVGFDTEQCLKAAADWCEENSRLFAIAWTEKEIPLDIKAYTHTVAIYAGDTAGKVPDNNKYAHIAWMSKCFGYTPGAETWTLKALNGITPSVLTSTKISSLKDSNANYFVQIAGKNVAQDGRTGTGEWIDVVRFEDWLVNQIQVQCFEYLSRNAKAAYNDSGITGLQGVLESVLMSAQRAGGIDSDRYDAEGNVEKGYTVTVPRASDVTTEDRRMRRLPGVTFTARLAGAIHEVKIVGSLVY